MSTVLGKDTTDPPNKQVQFLENKVNKLRHLNTSLNKEVFDAIQRGHRLATKLGYKDLDDAERSLATQVDQDSEEQQSQYEQLSQYSSEELASHVQALQAELVCHVQLSKATLSALQDALEEMTRLREDNERMKSELERETAMHTGEKTGGHGQDVVQELAFVRTELTTLRQRYADLRTAKEQADEKHAKDFAAWKAFKEWYDQDKDERRARKRRKPNLEGDDDDGDGGDGRGGKREGSSSVSVKVRRSKTPTMDRIHKKSRSKVMRSKSTLAPLARPSQGPLPPPVLVPKDINSSSSSILTSNASTPTKRRPVRPLPQKSIKREPSAVIPALNEHVPSSDTELDSQPVQFFYPSQQDVTSVPPSTAPPKQLGHPPVPDRDSSETELESQGPTFIFPPEIVPLTPAQVTDMTPKPKSGLRREKQQQLHTPVSVPRSQQHGKGQEKFELEMVTMPPPSSPSRSERLRNRAPSVVGNTKARLPDTPVSLPSKKGKERVVENDENAPDSTGSAPSTPSKKHPSSYSIYKGRGRYGAGVQAGKETINAVYEIDPGRNNGVNFQFEEVVRDKEKRKHMHAADCECCRDYYEAVGPLPSRLQPPMWRSPQSKGKKRPRDSFEDDEDYGDVVAIEKHKQEISRHRHHWGRGATPPGYWDIGFPDTQEVEDLNAEAQRMHEQKRALVVQEAQRGGKYRKR